MEDGIKYIKYEVLQEKTVITSGECPTFFLNTLTDVYCDFKGSPYTLMIYYDDKVFSVTSPSNFYNEKITSSTVKGN